MTVTLSSLRWHLVDSISTTELIDGDGVLLVFAADRVYWTEWEFDEDGDFGA